jgi:hypothetical protein
VKKQGTLKWIPLYVDKWLYGSTREELEPAECAVWIDILALAAKDDGYIRANEGFPYSVRRLAGLLGRDEELIGRTIEKCLATFTANPEERPKLTRLADGTLYVTNWEEYRLSERHERRFQPPAAAVPATPADTPASRGEEREKRVEKKRVDISVPDARSLIPPIIEKWNLFARAHNIPWIRGIEAGSTRERHLLARMRQPGFDFDKLLEAIDAQPFLLGENQSGWMCDFDFVITPSKYQKILEGGYCKSAAGAARARGLDSPYVGSNRHWRK